MAWVKLDDQFFLNSKVVRCERDDILLYLAGLTYCANQLTDGMISKEALPLLGAMAKVANAQASAQRLLEVGLWFATPNGAYEVHDYLIYNPTREEALRLKSARKEAGSRGGKASRSKIEATAQASAQALGQANAQAKSKQNPTPSPSPSPYPSLESPPLTPPQGGAEDKVNGQVEGNAAGVRPRRARARRSGSRMAGPSDGGESGGEFSRFSSVAK